MRLDQMLYRLTYRAGSPRWDTGLPRPELAGLVDGRAPGRALDIGCGTGTDALYLAGRGWDTTGIDFAPEAIAAHQAFNGALPDLDLLPMKLCPYFTRPI